MLTAVGTAAALVFSVLTHELAHGYVAQWNGDDTARRAGRLTWNPVKHVDPFLSLILPLCTYLLSGGLLVIGGAKPVPVNPFLYRGSRDRADLHVSLAGVCANACIAIAFLVALPVFSRFGGSLIAQRAIAANVALIVFNLLPIPPLDGWRVLECIRRPRRRRARGR